ncbi:MAG: peptidylprolyl isomerase [Alphaproteobacteria bacterium]|nr:MAG: peptidylprolyl isomerase [Alphaproteobacteria bacterium]
MRSLTRRAALAAALLASVFLSPAALAQLHAKTEVPVKDPENALVISLKSGDVVIELLPDVAPLHVERLKALARAGAYDNVVFHRVIDGFMAQTGDVRFGDRDGGYDPRRVGTGGSDLPDLPAEFSDIPFDRGVVGMARAQDPDSANSQFFIMFADGHFLNGQYTVLGRVVSGMEHVDAIRKGDRGRNGMVPDPDEMLSVRVLGDVQQGG